jgi:thiol-disulfide isomerase/thioredoxin
MTSDILLRFIITVGIIFFGLGVYWLVNQHLLARARDHANTLPEPLQNKPTIVYFTTPDCAPCKTVQRPALQRLTDLLGERLHIIEIDATQHPEVAQKWGVLSVPTTFLLDEKGAAKYVNNGVTRLEKLLEQVKSL